MKRPLGPTLALIFLLAFASQASAQVGAYLGGYIGYSAQTPKFDQAQFDTDTTFLYGFRAGVRVLMLGLEVNYFSAMHNIAMNDFWQFNWNGRVNDYTYIGLNLKGILKIAFLEAYLTGGYGYYTADIHNIDKDKEGGYNVGAGIEVRLGKRIGLVVEGKYHHVRVDISNFTIDLGNVTLCGGVNFHL